MAKILLIISALAMAASAYLGFATKQKVVAIQESLTTAKSDLTTARSDLTKAKGTLKKAEDELITAKATLEERDKEVAQQKSRVDTLTGDLTKATSDVDEKTKKIAEIQAQLDKLGTGPGVNVDDMVTKVRELSEAKARLELQVGELTQVQTSLNQKLADEKAKLSTAERSVTEYKQNYTRPGVSGTILAYNPGWNFVYVNLGDRQGLKVGKEMVVKRSGQMIAKVRITSVEPGSSIADIVPGSSVKGVSVEPGDSVIYEGRN